MAFLSPIKAMSGDMLDHHLEKLYFNGGTIISMANREINIHSLPAQPY
jgi:hypothetical protein